LIQRHLTPWRKAFLYALFPLGIKVADQLNHTPQFYLGYDTTVPRAHYIVTQWGGRAQELLSTYLLAVFLIAVALGFLRWAWGWTPEQLPPWPRDRRGVFWRDTLLVVSASMVILWLLDLLNAEALGHFWPAEAAAIRYWSVEEWAPWIGAVTEALQYAWDQTIHLAILASILRLVWGRHPKVVWGALLLVPLLKLGIPQTLGGFLWGLGFAEISLLVTLWLALKVWRFNVAAIFLTYAGYSIWDAVRLFLVKGGAGYRGQAVWLLGAMAVAAGVALFLEGKGPSGTYSTEK